jgi:hypothetical protein
VHYQFDDPASELSEKLIAAATEKWVKMIRHAGIKAD